MITDYVDDRRPLVRVLFRSSPRLVCTRVFSPSRKRFGPVCWMADADVRHPESFVHAGGGRYRVFGPLVLSNGPLLSPGERLGMVVCHSDGSLTLRCVC